MKFRSENQIDQQNGSSSDVSNEEDKLSDLMKMSRHLAHELNNHLTTIMANSQLVSLMVEEENLKSYLNAVEEATIDAGKLVREYQKSIRELDKLPV